MKKVKVELDDLTWYVRPSDKGAIQNAYSFVSADGEEILLWRQDRRYKDRPGVPLMDFPKFYWRPAPKTRFEPWNDDLPPKSGWKEAKLRDQFSAPGFRGRQVVYRRENGSAADEHEQMTAILESLSNIENAAVYNGEGMAVTLGLQPTHTSDQAIRVARSLAADHGEELFLLDSDGAWIVSPNGEFELIEEPDHWLYEGILQET